MEVIYCKNCNKELTQNMGIEYSDEVNEFFCNPDCAVNYYFDYMKSTPVVENEKRKELDVRIIDGKLNKVMFS